MEMLIHSISLLDGCEASEQADTDDPVTDVLRRPLDKLMMIQQYKTVNVTMVTCTANSKLTVSDDENNLWVLEWWENPCRQIIVGPSLEDGAWILYGTGDQYFYNFLNSKQPYRRQKDQKIDVFVDVEEGDVSFYDVEDKITQIE